MTLLCSAPVSKDGRGDANAPARCLKAWLTQRKSGSPSEGTERGFRDLKVPFKQPWFHRSDPCNQNTQGRFHRASLTDWFVLNQVDQELPHISPSLLLLRARGSALPQYFTVSSLKSTQDGWDYTTRESIVCLPLALGQHESGHSALLTAVILCPRRQDQLCFPQE